MSSSPVNWLIKASSDLATPRQREGRETARDSLTLTPKLMSVDTGSWICFESMMMLPRQAGGLNAKKPALEAKVQLRCRAATANRLSRDRRHQRQLQMGLQETFVCCVHPWLGKAKLNASSLDVAAITAW